VGAQFQHPYIFKSILTKEPIVFADLCETKNVVKGEIFIVNEFDRRFVGRIGQFTPVREDAGIGGGALVRVVPDAEGNPKDFAVTGTKGYLWLESEQVGKMDNWAEVVDMGYYEDLKAKADKALVEVGCPPWDLVP
jgi:hypothetical protein